MSVKRTMFFSFCFLLLSIFYTRYSASVISAVGPVFVDDFEDNHSRWRVISGDWVKVNEDGNTSYMTKSSSKEVWSLVVPDNNSLFSLKNYSLSVRLRSDNGVDQLLLFRLSDDYGSFYSVDLRASGWVDSDNIRIGKTVSGNLLWDDELTPPQIGCHIVNGDWYDLKVNINEENIDVSIKCPTDTDYRKIYSKTDTEIINSGSIGLASWSGHWDQDTIKYFDNVEINSNEGNFEQNPIIIVPGLGASWNTEAILLGENRDQSEWSMTPFVKEYDNLIKAFEGAGYVKNENLFVFNYDWRRSVDDISFELGDFIKENLSGEKPILVGHSLGGLVARDYWQDNVESVDRVVTLGSPHRGVVLAYEALAGGRVGDELGWGSVAANILTLLRAPKYSTTAEMLRNEVPSLYDLSPTFDFLFKGRRIIPYSDLFYQNDWLDNLNSSLPVSDDIDYVSGNTGENVVSQILVKNQSALDKMLGLWPDGVPYRCKKGLGDETVLLSSSYLGDSQENVFNVSHRDLPSDSEVITSVLDILDITATTYSDEELFPIDDSLIFVVASPVSMKVVTPSSEYQADEQGMVVIAHPDKGEYRVVLEKTGEGVYHLVLGRLFGNSLWNYYEGVARDSAVEYVFDIDPNDDDKNPLIESEKDRLEAILAEIDSLQESYFSDLLSSCELNVISAISEIDSENYPQALGFVAAAINNLFDFRKSQESIEALNKSWRLVELLTDVYSSLLEKLGGVSRNEAYGQYRKASKEYSLSWRKIRLLDRKNQLKKFLLVEYDQGQQLFETAKSNLKLRDYPSVYSYGYSAEQNFR